MNAPDSVSARLSTQSATVRRSRLKHWFFVLLIAAGIIAGVVIWSPGNESTASVFVTQSVERGNLTIAVSATGSLEPTNEVEVGSEISGIVSSVLVDTNDRVTQGQVLAQIDTTRLETQAMQARASLDASDAQVLQREATLENAVRQLDRMERANSLSGGNNIATEDDLDTLRTTVKRAEADLASARASVIQSQAAVETIETDLAKATIYSPIDGVVMTRGIEPGQTVAASFQAPVLFTIAEDLTKMKLTVNVDEADVGQVHAGQRATFTVDAYPDRVFEAVIDDVHFASETISGVVTYPAILFVENPDLLLRPDMTATAEIVVEHVEDAVLVPNAALRFQPPMQQLPGAGPPGGPGGAPPGAGPPGGRPGGAIVGRLLPRPPGGQAPRRQDENAAPQVWVENDGIPVPIPVRVGATDGTRSVILDGALQPGMAVIVDMSVGRP